MMLPDYSDIKFLRSAVTLGSAFLAVSQTVFAAEPVLDVRQKLAYSAFEYEVNTRSNMSLSVYPTGSQSRIGNYDISECMFCDGEDDNCESDGIIEVILMSRPKEPILAVTCHVGAHSQRLQIFAPMQDQDGAVHTVTGAYFLTPQRRPEGIGFEYDVSDGEGAFRSVTGSWP